VGTPVNGAPPIEVVLRSVHFGGAAGRHGRGSLHRAQLVLWFRFLRLQSSNGSPGPRQLPFGPGACPYPASYVRRAAEGSSLAPRFPVAFRPAGIGLSDHPVPPLGVGPPLRSAYRATPGPRRGFHVPHGRDPTGEGALCTPGPRCSHDRRSFPGRRRRLPAAGPVPQHCIPSPGVSVTRHQMRDRLRSPVRSSPCLWPPYGAGTLGLFALMLRTPPLPATHVRVGTDHEHFSGAHRRLHARSSSQ
jgi:hypothetical protein